MIQFNKVVGATCLLALGGLGGCSSGLEYNVKPEDIARQAEANEGSTAWATDVRAVQRGKDNHVYWPGQWKCNLFVHDMIFDAGGSPPLRAGDWPPYAKEWANASFYIPNWEHKGTNVTWERGDVIARQIGDGTNQGASGHCGIAISSSKVMAAGAEKVHDGSDGDHKLAGCSVRRYTGN